MRITRQQWDHARQRHSSAATAIRAGKGTRRDVDAMIGVAELMNRLFEEIAMLDATILKIATAANQTILADKQQIADANTARDAAVSRVNDLQTQLAAQQQQASQNALGDATVQALTTLGNTLGVPLDTPAPGVDVTITPGATVGAGPVLKNAGGVLQTDAGQTLYTFSGATPDATFAPYYVPAAPTGVDGLGAVSVNDQLLATWNSSPLYTFPGEPAGNVTQDGANGGQWKAVHV